MYAVLISEALLVGVWAVIIAFGLGRRETPFDWWFVALWVAGVALPVLVALAAYGCRRRFIGKAVLALEVLGAAAGFGLIIASLVPYAAGWGGRSLGDIEIGWQGALLQGLIIWAPLGATAGALLGGLAAAARALWAVRQQHP